MGGVRVLENGRHIEDYTKSFVSLCQRLADRLRILFTYRGVTWNDTFIDAYWPASPVYPESGYGRWQRILRVTGDNVAGLQYTEMAELVDYVIDGLLVTSAYVSPGILYDRIGSGASAVDARNFVRPDTRATLGATRAARTATFAALVGRAMPLRRKYRAADARVLNWMHDLLDHVYLIRIPKGAIKCDVKSPWINYDLAYQPRVRYRRYPNTGAHIAGFVWPWYQPNAAGGTQTTSTQPAVVWVEQRVNRVAIPTNPPWATYSYDPWPGLLAGDRLVSGNPAHGWYYSTLSQLYDQPLNRSYAGWVSYQRYWGNTTGEPNPTQVWMHAEAYRGRYRSTLDQLDTWASVADHVEYWEWVIECRNDPRATGDVTFVVETASERYTWTLGPGEVSTETVRLTEPEVELYLDHPWPTAAPHDLYQAGGYPWYSTPYGGTSALIGYKQIAATVMRARQEPLPDLYVDIRPQLLHE